ncbi:MAG: hypothetical protein K0B09_14395 [Bacteroidales bacterium]|nr:hypothetical protein [Bacteroidales bacterium]
MSKTPSGFIECKEEVQKLSNRLNSSNYREVKDELISLQRNLGQLDLSRDERTLLKETIDHCFEKINAFRESEQKAFELTSEQNRGKLTPLVEKALFEARYNDDIRQAWDFCVSVQNEFKGIRLQKEIREMLYQQLQEAFDMLKQRRSQQQSVLEQKSLSGKKVLLPVVEAMVAEAEKATDVEDHWRKLIELQQEIKDRDLTFEARNELLNKLQEAFTIIKLIREEKQAEEAQQSFSNALTLDEMITEGEALASNSDEFKVVFDRLKQIQQAFRGFSLPAEEREDLYQRLQQAFETIKGRQEAWFSERDRETRENYNRLKPLVLNGLERARTSNEFKKTREMLKNIQAEFKGLRMKAESRQELYSQLQKAFDILNQRHDEYMATKKDKMELKVDYQLSDIELRIEEMQQEIEKDREHMAELSETGDNPLFKGSETDPADDIHNQVQVLMAAISRKENLLFELLHEKESLLQKKEKWASLGNETDET